MFADLGNLPEIPDTTNFSRDMLDFLFPSIYDGSPANGKFTSAFRKQIHLVVFNSTKLRVVHFDLGSTLNLISISFELRLTFFLS